MGHQTFHALCREACEKAQIRFQAPDGDGASNFWNEEAPELLLNSLDELADYRFDAVIVDEAQDFEASWWVPVERLLKCKDKYLYIFYDRRQNLYSKIVSFPSCGARFDLTLNCRNTCKIAETCGAIIEDSVELSPFAPFGTLTQIIRYKDRKDAQSRAETALNYLVDNLKIPKSGVACLSPYSPEKSSLTGGKVGKHLTTSDLDAWRKGSAVWLSSIKAFKGLEADALILTDLADFKKGFFDKADFYVACSRARLILVVLTESDT